MGYFNDIVVAPMSDADAVARKSLPARAWPGIELKNINIIDLDVLFEAIVPPANWSDLDSISQHFPEVPVTKKRAVVFRFPDVLITSLADASLADLQTYAQRWSESEEFRGTWPPEELVTVLQDLQILTQKARAEGHAVLYCMAG